MDPTLECVWCELLIIGEPVRDPLNPDAAWCGHHCADADSETYWTARWSA